MIPGIDAAKINSIIKYQANPTKENLARAMDTLDMMQIITFLGIPLKKLNEAQQITTYFVCLGTVPDLDGVTFEIRGFQYEGVDIFLSTVDHTTFLNNESSFMDIIELYNTLEEMAQEAIRS